MPITAPLNAAEVPLVKHLPRCPTKYAGLCARRCGGTSATVAAQSNRRPSTALPVAGARGLPTRLAIKKQSGQSRNLWPGAVTAAGRSSAGPDTRDIIQNVYMRWTEMKDGKLANLD